MGEAGFEGLHVVLLSGYLSQQDHLLCVSVTSRLQAVEIDPCGDPFSLFVPPVPASGVQARGFNFPGQGFD